MRGVAQAESLQVNTMAYAGGPCGDGHLTVVCLVRRHMCTCYCLCSFQNPSASHTNSYALITPLQKVT